MGGYPNKIGLQGHPLNTDVRVLKEPRTVPYNRIGSAERIRTVSVPYRTVTHCWQTSDSLEFSVDFFIYLLTQAIGKIRAAQSLEQASC